MATILIAEDDATIRVTLQHVLERAGHTVHVARDGLEALSTLDSTLIDVLITDIRMPVLNGADLISVVRSAESQLRVILMSVDLRSRQYADALAQADLVLAKPVDLPRLVSSIAALTSDASLR
jgi:CheY-like chemotaxis protein